MTKPAPSPLDAIFARDAEGQTQMTTTTPDHIAVANKKVEPYAYAYERTDLPEEMRDFFEQSLHIKQIEYVPPNWTELPLYTHPAPPSELVKAAEDVLELFLRVWISDDGINLTPEEKGKLNALRIELNKFK